MAESEIHPKVQKLIEYFDTESERLLDFDKPLDSGKTPREHLNYLIKTENGWNKIAATCRRMIICDRELDLKKGNDLIDETIDEFKGLENTYEEQPYEAIRYANTCGLISYRIGNYSNALDYFTQAKDMAEDYEYNMGCFIPDTTSNVIRTKFELFARVLPNEIKEDYIQTCENNFVGYIKEYKYAICESSKHEPDDGKNLYLIYGHGMASLYHNLGEVYSTALKIGEKVSNFEWSAIELRRLGSKAKEQNECSLDWGEKIGDTYRQLQSKRALSGLKVEKWLEYEEDVLKGRWQRGKQMIYQKRIGESNNLDEAQGYINRDDFKLDETGDKIGILYNYDAIKDFLVNKGVDLIWAKKRNLTRLDIAQKKIEIAEDLRSELSPLLYKRQVINLIRDDVAYITHDYLDKGNYPKALDFSGKYSNRSLIELSKIDINRDSKVFHDQEKKISKYKTNILNIEDDKQQIEHNDDCEMRLSTNLSTILSNETDEDFLKLIFAYEDILKQPTDSPVPYNIENECLSKILIDRLGNIPYEENTAVIKFFFVEFKQKEKQSRIWWSLLIDCEGIREAKKINIDSFEKWISEVKDILEYFKKTKLISNNTELYNKMDELSSELKLYEKLDGIKNLFIIPDGELFQLPLHLLSKNGHDLRTGMNVYYSPSLNQLLNTDMGASLGNEKASYLWLTSPTMDLYTTSNEPCLKTPNANENEIDTIECMDATLESFKSRYMQKKFTHVGLSTHAAFHDNLVTAYVSSIRFSDSFLTSYDILLLHADYFSGVQTIFLGACSGGSSRYTDENETVGIVTAFLAKKARSVIAPLCIINVFRHNSFIELVNESGILSSPNSWNLSDILTDIENKNQLAYLIPFVQYANLELIEEKCISSEK